MKAGVKEKEEKTPGKNKTEETKIPNDSIPLPHPHPPQKSGMYI